MKEDFVSFSLAKKLKEKGYTLDTAHHYDDNGGIVVSLVEFDERCVYPCPEIHQVLKWLREEKGISLNVYPSYFGNLLYWTCDVISFIGEISIEKRLGGDVKTYEEAAIYGLEYVLDNLI